MVVVATGFFDGVHLGHRLVIDALVRKARQTGGTSVVATFWPHPRTVLQNGARELRLLSSLQEKKMLLESLGVDRVEVLGFTRSFSSMTARQYLQDVVIGHFHADAIVLGYDNRMGSDALSREEIISLAGSLGLEVVSPDTFYNDDSAPVSSTMIRKTISSGDVASASAMLGYNYPLHGVVVAGNRMGRTIGFPTANMQLYEPLKLLPGNGVYLVDVETLGCRFRGMTNVGVRPTVSSAAVTTIETNIFDFDEQIYGLDIKVSFLKKIRDERRFASLEELRLQLENDRRICILEK